LNIQNLLEGCDVPVNIFVPNVTTSYFLKPAILCLRLLRFTDRYDNRALLVDNSVEIPFQQVAALAGSGGFAEGSCSRGCGVKCGIGRSGEPSQSPSPRPPAGRIVTGISPVF
jgi:hypothetical protein